MAGSGRAVDLGPEHILLALTLSQETEAGRLLAMHGINPESLQAASRPGAQTVPRPAQQQQESTTPTLDEYGRDLTAMARNGEIDPVIGRDGGDRADHRDPLPPHQEQPRADR